MNVTGLDSIMTLDFGRARSLIGSGPACSAGLQSGLTLPVLRFCRHAGSLLLTSPAAAVLLPMARFYQASEIQIWRIYKARAGSDSGQPRFALYWPIGSFYWSFGMCLKRISLKIPCSGSLPTFFAGFQCGSSRIKRAADLGWPCGVSTLHVGGGGSNTSNKRRTTAVTGVLATCDIYTHYFRVRPPGKNIWKKAVLFSFWLTYLELEDNTGSKSSTVSPQPAWKSLTSQRGEPFPRPFIWPLRASDSGTRSYTR